MSNYFIVGYNPQTKDWDILDDQVPGDQAVELREQLKACTHYTHINIVPCD